MSGKQRAKSKEKGIAIGEEMSVPANETDEVLLREITEMIENVSPKRAAGFYIVDDDNAVHAVGGGIPPEELACALGEYFKENKKKVH